MKKKMLGCKRIFSILFSSSLSNITYIIRLTQVNVGLVNCIVVYFSNVFFCFAALFCTVALVFFIL